MEHTPSQFDEDEKDLDPYENIDDEDDPNLVDGEDEDDIEDDIY